MSKYTKDDSVRVTDPAHEKFDRVGVVDSVFKDGWHWVYTVQFGNLYMPILEHHLILAIPPVTEVLDEMDAQSTIGSFIQAPDKDDCEVKSEGAPERTGITANDKLRLIADTVERQAPFGTELANFRRRLSAILSIGHDA